MAHAFSDALDVQIRNGRRLTGADRRHLLWSNLEYIYVAIPPILLTIALALLGWDANDVVFVVQILGLASLFFWGAYAARTAGLGGWRQVDLRLQLQPDGPGRHRRGTAAHPLTCHAGCPSAPGRASSPAATPPRKAAPSAPGSCRSTTVCPPS